MWCFASECYTLSLVRLGKSPKWIFGCIGAFMWSNLSVGCLDGQLYGSVGVLWVVYIAGAGFTGGKRCAAGSALTSGRTLVGLVFFFFSSRILEFCHMIV